ncbi:MAG: hypothetical protein BRD48_00875 [Bacteroidetes bacterium QS_9_68_14]|nr:MAG: hypothetical protein BRD48_00875 [Bacteroidetes bacterium QS_9_68_14]
MKRFSSRREAISESFLEERLRSALSYDRIAGDARPGGPAQPTATATRVRLRDGTEHTLALPEEDGRSWAALT